MLRIQCPFCGLRDHSEFSYGGDATIVYPDLAAPQDAWEAAIFTRDNPCGVLRERWQHVDGCRLWLVVERNTLTHDILSVKLARTDLAPLLQEAAG